MHSNSCSSACAAAVLVFNSSRSADSAAGSGSASTNNGSSSPVATIPTLATWLTNGFWTNQGTLAHHWASNTITYNLGNLNAQEQALALSALTAWSQVANINFVQVASGANINFNHNGTMQAVTNASWNGSGLMTSATVDISTDWVTTDGGANQAGTLFSIDTDSNNFQVMFSFTAAHPMSSSGYDMGLTLVGSTLYGTTAGNGTDGGTVFSIDADGNNYQVLHAFSNTTSDGFQPYANLTLVGSTLYGTTYAGGSAPALNRDACSGPISTESLSLSTCVPR